MPDDLWDRRPSRLRTVLNAEQSSHAATWRLSRAHASSPLRTESLCLLLYSFDREKLEPDKHSG